MTEEEPSSLTTYDDVYRRTVQAVLNYGRPKGDRTNTGTLSVPPLDAHFNLLGGYPLIGLKFTSFRVVLHELLWFLDGDTNVNTLKNKKVNIWNEWADTNGDLGPIYGQQWRSWPCPDGRIIDQIHELIDSLLVKPESRRMIVSAWNPADLPAEEISPQDNVALGLQALAPCHVLFQAHSLEATVGERLQWAYNQNPDRWGDEYHAEEKSANLAEKLDAYEIPDRGLGIQIYQRSADLFLGVPYNWASYSLLTYLLAAITDHIPMFMHWNGGDIHLYKNHLEQVEELLQREPLPSASLRLHRPVSNLDDLLKLDVEDFELQYQHHPSIKAPVAV